MGASAALLCARGFQRSDNGNRECRPVGFSTHLQGKLHFSWLFKKYLSEKVPELISGVYLLPSLHMGRRTLILNTSENT